MVECSGVEAECFLALQAAGLELSLQTIPVSSPDHAAKYIVQMVRTELTIPQLLFIVI